MEMRLLLNTTHAHSSATADAASDMGVVEIVDDAVGDTTVVVVVVAAVALRSVLCIAIAASQMVGRAAVCGRTSCHSVRSVPCITI